MAVVRPVNLGNPQTTIGGATAIDPRVAALALAQAKQGANLQPAANAPSPYDSQYAMAQALAMTPRVEGTSPWEAVAAALTGGLRGRMALREHEQELKQQDAQNQWAQALQQRQRQEWQTADQQTQAEQDLAANAPEDQRSLASAFPHEYAGARIRQMLTPQYHTLTPDEVRGAGFQAGSVVQQNPQTGEYQVQQGPYHPSQAIVIGGSNTPDEVGYVADLVQNQGQQAATPFFQRNPRLAQQVVAELARRRAGGDQSADPASVGVAHATYRANASSLTQLTTQRTAILRAENAARRNIQLAQQTLGQLQRSNSHFANTWLQRGAALGNAPQLAAAKIALERSLDEYARVITGAYGAGGTPVTQMQNAREMISTASTPQEAQAAFNIILSEMNNVRSSFDDQENELRANMGGRPTAPAPPATPQANAPAPTQRLRYNPQTRQLEPVQ